MNHGSLFPQRYLLIVHDSHQESSRGSHVAKLVYFLRKIGAERGLGWPLPKKNQAQ